MPDDLRLFGTSAEAQSREALFITFPVLSQEATHVLCLQMAYLSTPLTVLYRVMIPPRSGKIG